MKDSGSDFSSISILLIISKFIQSYNNRTNKTQTLNLKNLNNHKRRKTAFMQSNADTRFQDKNLKYSPKDLAKWTVLS